MAQKLSEAPSLPWFRDANDLPRALPTTAEIDAATTELPSIFDRRSRRTVLVHDCFVVKYGPFVFENEGHALLLLDSLDEIPTPRLYAMYRENDKLYLVMEFVRGHQLGEIWPSLSEDEKNSIVGHLRSAFNSMRALPSPGVFASVCGGALPHRWFFSLDNNRHITGPFEQEESLCRALVLKSRDNWDQVGRHGWMTDFFERHLSNMMQGHESVFSHPDFQRKNVIVRQRDNDAAAGNMQRHFEVAAILDWEEAGWYPSYWNYSYCFTYFDWTDDWAEKVERILDPCPREASLLRMLDHDLDA